MVCTRVEPAIFEKREDLEVRGCSERGDPEPPPPMHLREQHFKIFGVIRGQLCMPISNLFWSVFVDQVFASFYQIFCYKLSWNYLKFWGRESAKSLILNLYPYPSETFYVSNGVFLRENGPVLLNVFWGRPPDVL